MVVEREPLLELRPVGRLLEREGAQQPGGRAPLTRGGERGELRVERLVGDVGSARSPDQPAARLVVARVQLVEVGGGGGRTVIRKWSEVALCAWGAPRKL